MILPSPWVGLVLGLGAFRLMRLLSYDSFPPFERARGWILGEETVTVGSAATRMGITNEDPQVSVRYRRPLLAELVHCAFCLGLWLAGGIYAAWLLEPRWTIYAAVPFALSSFVGLVARNLDP